MSGSVLDLTAAEQLLVWSARRWRHGRHGWEQVEAEFRRHLGAGWADALLAWEEALDLLHRWPTRLPLIANGCETSVTLDERRLLTCVALMRAGSPASTAVLVRHLAAAPERAELVGALARVASVSGPLPLAAPRRPAGDGPLRRAVS
ncbi:MAG TPA: hypothetical protein VEB20_00540 [Azospirillaceae bacterium]|nr:hypothetical protein [Azospirillaceae bacterium]